MPWLLLVRLRRGMHRKVVRVGWVTVLVLLCSRLMV